MMSFHSLSEGLSGILNVFCLCSFKKETTRLCPLSMALRSLISQNASVWFRKNENVSWLLVKSKKVKTVSNALVVFFFSF